MSHMSELTENLRGILHPMTSCLAWSDWQPPRSLLLTAQALRTWTWLLQALRKRHFQENEKFCSLKAGFQGKLGLLRRRIRENGKKNESPWGWRKRFEGTDTLSLQILPWLQREESVQLMLIMLAYEHEWKCHSGLRSLHSHSKFIEQKNKTDL